MGNGGVVMNRAINVVEASGCYRKVTNMILYGIAKALGYGYNHIIR